MINDDESRCDRWRVGIKQLISQLDNPDLEPGDVHELFSEEHKQYIVVPEDAAPGEYLEISLTLQQQLPVMDEDEAFEVLDDWELLEMAMTALLAAGEEDPERILRELDLWLEE